MLLNGWILQLLPYTTQSDDVGCWLLVAGAFGGAHLIPYPLSLLRDAFRVNTVWMSDWISFSLQWQTPPLSGSELGRAGSEYSSDRVFCPFVGQSHAKASSQYLRNPQPSRRCRSQVESDRLCCIVSEQLQHGITIHSIVQVNVEGTWSFTKLSSWWITRWISTKERGVQALANSKQEVGDEINLVGVGPISFRTPCIRKNSQFPSSADFRFLVSFPALPGDFRFNSVCLQSPPLTDHTCLRTKYAHASSNLWNRG